MPRMTRKARSRSREPGRQRTLLDNPKIAARMRAEGDAPATPHRHASIRSPPNSKKPASSPRRRKQSATPVDASLGKAKLHGLIVDKNELSGRLGHYTTRKHSKQLADWMTPREREIRLRLRDDFVYYAPRCLNIRTKSGRGRSVQPERRPTLPSRATRRRRRRTPAKSAPWS